LVLSGAISKDHKLPVLPMATLVRFIPRLHDEAGSTSWL